MEEKGKYIVDAVPDNDLAYRNKPYSQTYASGNYEPPPPKVIRALRNLAGWSQNDVAKLVGVGFNPKKGSTTIRKWETDPANSEHRTIPYAAWRLMLLEAGIVRLENG